MPTYPRVVAVDAPTVSATVLYDFNDDVAVAHSETHADGFSLGSLDLLGDPDAVGVEWAQQTITIPQTIVATSKSAALARLQSMARTLMRQRFWIMVQLTAATAPVFWRAYRTPPGELSMDQVYVEGNRTDRWLLSANVDVDAFSHGVRVTQPAQTVGNDPAVSASPASGYNLPTIKGDAPTRLRVKITPSTGSPPPQRWLVSCVASDRPSPILRSPIGTGDGLTVAPMVSAPNNAGDAVGGSNRLVNFPDTGRQFALQGPFPLAGALPGRYLVLLRCAAIASTAAGVTVAFQLTTGAPVGLAPMVSAKWFEVGGQVDNYQYVPLGVIGIGDGLPVGVPAPSQRQMNLYMQSSDADATGKLDEFVFIPVSGPGVASTTTMILTTTGRAPNGQLPLLIDGDDEVDWLSGIADGECTIGNSGAFPVADPAAAYNRLLVMPLSTASFVNTATDTRSTGLGATASVEVSYHPRSAYLGDGS